MFSSKNLFFSIQTLFSLNTQLFYLFGTPLPPPSDQKQQNVSFMALFKNLILEVSQSHKKFFGSHYMCGEVRNKKLGQKVNVKYFRVDPYTLGNRIPRVFQNLSDLHVRCHREKFYIEFLSQNFFGSHYTCGGVRKRFWGTKSMKKISGQTQEEKIPKNE